MTKRLVLLVFTLLLAAVWSGCARQPVTSGSAPDFTLASLDGGTVTLGDLQGQVVTLDFWASWCAPCVEGLDHLQQMHERYAGQGMVVLAINVEETQEEAADFLEGRGYTFTVLLDVDGRVSDAYGVQAIPHTLIVDREREVHYVLGWSDEVEETLRALLAE
ncbi:MAG: TlpA family protein disulfide reductase [Chloroflexi bacterium]|nr:TlpA family protein disulfide reductase [Chloroflexota bacterium]